MGEPHLLAIMISDGSFLRAIAATIALIGFGQTITPTRHGLE
jgi:hypothetical protein